MAEYVRVTFATSRQVWVDGQSAGITNKVFQVETGDHTFDLGPKQNYKPPSQECMVTGTLPQQPMVIPFERTDV